jgi:N-carbamoyl-L-amino-acid hydrolase
MARPSTPAALAIDGDRLLRRLRELGEIGADPRGGRTRLALTDADKAARELIVRWLSEAGAAVRIDRIGNIHGVLEGRSDLPPIATGSHIDTVVRAGAYDGCYGVVAGIEVLQTLSAAGELPRASVAVLVFTNEEGVRFAPDLLGSRVVAENVALEDALALHSADGCSIDEELRRIGFAGSVSPRELRPSHFVELHIEQGPMLEAEDLTIGIVEAVQGHSWWRVVIEGVANHAGTTPMALRRDAGATAMQLACALIRDAEERGVPNVATVGTITFEPGAINVVPGRATFTIDMRDDSVYSLRRAEQRLHEALLRLDRAGYTTHAQCTSRHEPVVFDDELCGLLQRVAAQRGLAARRMLSGASHDAQMMAGVCPSAMIFVPSHRGISHNPAEHTEPRQLVQGADLLLHALLELANNPETCHAPSSL